MSGINVENLEQLYNPLYTGIGSMEETREFLIERGMTTALADNLAKEYLLNLESKNAQIFSLMDFFNSKKNDSKAINALMAADMSSIHLNYRTFN